MKVQETKRTINWFQIAKELRELLFVSFQFELRGDEPVNQKVSKVIMS